MTIAWGRTQPAAGCHPAPHSLPPAAESFAACATHPRRGLVAARVRTPITPRVVIAAAWAIVVIRGRVVAAVIWRSVETERETPPPVKSVAIKTAAVISVAAVKSV